MQRFNYELIIDSIQVDDGWIEWSLSCRGGTKTKSKSGTHPKPANGGHDCVGDAKETTDCNSRICSSDRLFKYVHASLFFENFSVNFP